MTVICPKCGHDQRTDFPIGGLCRYWAWLVKVEGYTQKRIRIRSVNGSYKSIVHPSSLQLLPDDFDYEIEKNEDTRFLYGNWREMRYSVCLKPSSQEQE